MHTFRLSIPSASLLLLLLTKIQINIKNLVVVIGPVEMCKSGLNSYKTTGFSVHSVSVENLWKTYRACGKLSLPAFSTAVHSRISTAPAEKWKTIIQISENKRLTPMHNSTLYVEKIYMHLTLKHL